MSSPALSGLMRMSPTCRVSPRGDKLSGGLVGICLGQGVVHVYRRRCRRSSRIAMGAFIIQVPDAQRCRYLRGS